MLSLRALCASLLAVALAPSVAAQTPPVTEKHVVREGFRFPADRAPRVLLFRPEIRVGEQTTAGLFQPNAEWNESGRTDEAAGQFWGALLQGRRYNKKGQVR